MPAGLLPGSAGSFRAPPAAAMVERPKWQSAPRVGRCGDEIGQGRAGRDELRKYRPDFGPGLQAVVARRFRPDGVPGQPAATQARRSCSSELKPAVSLAAETLAPASSARFATARRTPRSQA